MANELMPIDRFIVYNKNVLNDYDRNILNLLYQPIVGADTLSLYYNFWTLISGVFVSKEKTHHYLMAMMHFDLLKIELARKKLEAIGLLKTYIKKEKINHYIYELYVPLIPIDFFKNPILNACLKKNIGEEEYNHIVQLFLYEKIDFSEYKNISKNFSDVFKMKCYEANDEMFIGKNGNNVFVDDMLDIENVLQRISDDILLYKLISDEDKKHLKNLSFVYNLNEDILEDLIVGSVNQYKKIDFLKLRKKCESVFKYEYDGKMPELVLKTQPEHLKVGKEIINDRQRLIYTFETTNPRDYLVFKNGNVDLSRGEQQILAYLLVDLRLNPGVVNVLIDYVLRINDYKLVKNFVETIAMQWKRAKINTVEEAMEIAEREHRRRKDGDYKKKTKKEEKVPDWFNKKINSEKLDDKKQKEIEARLKEYD